MRPDPQALADALGIADGSTLLSAQGARLSILVRSREMAERSLRPGARPLPYRVVAGARPWRVDNNLPL
jgi:hypothetical protein